MHRRTFLYSTASAATSTVGFSTASTITPDSDFLEEYSYAVAHFFDENWDRATLEEATFEAVNHVCYAYGNVENLTGSDPSEESGYLSQLADVASTTEIADWAAENLGYLAYFVENLGVISDGVVKKIEEMVEKVRDGTKYVPLVLSIKGVLDEGCSIHSQVETGKEIAKETYTEFFKRVALVAVEIILLAAGIPVAYKTAFGVTGWANRRLINAVGRHIGWEAYSWVLSQIHWGIRVVFAEGMGEAIDNTVEIVTADVVSAARSEGDDLSRDVVEQQAQTHVEDMADYTDKWSYNYELWDAKRRIRVTKQQAEQQAKDTREEFLDLLPFATSERAVRL
ncbi:hypothetical protein [Halosolutus halophilus]|uniref:hypothetical protein n=1 Tax=Halosolutus halophilus TaxID=1552990 RepID=UPI0022352C28|nr:hypothetical protein [Halosolutus halophilus]